MFLWVTMKIFTSLAELQKISDFNQLETPVAITAPFIVSDRVIIGLYGRSFEYACIDVSVPGFQKIKEFWHSLPDDAVRSSSETRHGCLYRYQIYSGILVPVFRCKELSGSNYRGSEKHT
jgi:hypothetical protein